MKTNTIALKKVMMIVTSLFLTSAVLLADGETSEVYLSGNSNSFAGEFVVRLTTDRYHFQGREYEVYKISYDHPGMNMNVAVNMEGNCNSFVVYNGEFNFFYNCNKYGFGVRKVMFADPWVNDQFSPEEYQKQTIMKCDKKIEKKEALSLIASYVPQLYRRDILN